jgi:hypothetical protein
VVRIYLPPVSASSCAPGRMVPASFTFLIPLNPESLQMIRSLLPSIRGSSLLGSLSLAFMAGSLFLASENLEAQVTVVPQAGIYAPLSDLGELRDDTGETLLELGRRESTLAFGATFETGDPESSVLGVRAGFGFATRSDVPIQGVGCEDCAARSSLLTAGAALVLHPFPRLALLRPYLVAGGGVAYYDFDDEELREEGWQNALQDQAQAQLHLGLGTHLFLGPLRPRIELGAHISRFNPTDESITPLGVTGVGEGDRQANLFLMVGIPFGG